MFGNEDDIYDEKIVLKAKVKELEEENTRLSNEHFNYIDKIGELDNMLKEQIKYNDKITKTNASLSEELSGYKDNVVAEFSGKNNPVDNDIWNASSDHDNVDSIIEDTEQSLYLVSYDKRVVIAENYRVLVIKQN